MERPPPPGVSSLGEDMNRTPIQDDPPPKVAATRPKGQNRQQVAPRRGAEVLKKHHGGREILQQDAPAGVQSRQASVVEIPMPHMRTPQAATCEFTSVDGSTYTFRTKDSKGRPLAYRNEQCLFVAMVELMKGGDPSVVFDAFKLKIEDFVGKKYYPIPPHLLQRGPLDLGYDGPDVGYGTDQTEEEEEPTGMSLGE